MILLLLFIPVGVSYESLCLLSPAVGRKTRPALVQTETEMLLQSHTSLAAACATHTLKALCTPATTAFIHHQYLCCCFQRTTRWAFGQREILLFFMMLLSMPACLSLSVSLERFPVALYRCLPPLGKWMTVQSQLWLLSWAAGNLNLVSVYYLALAAAERLQTGHHCRILSSFLYLLAYQVRVEWLVLGWTGDLSREHLSHPLAAGTDPVED